MRVCGSPISIRAAKSGRKFQIADAKRVFKKKDRSKELLRRELRTNFVFAAVSASEAYMTQVPMRLVPFLRVALHQRDRSADSA